MAERRAVGWHVRPRPASLPTLILLSYLCVIASVVLELFLELVHINSDEIEDDDPDFGGQIRLQRNSMHRLQVTLCWNET